MEFSQNWFERNIPIWERLFIPLSGQPLKALEIGCFEGQATTWLLDKVLTHTESRITCIDPFESDQELKEADFKKVKERFLKNTEIYRDKVQLYCEKSVHFLSQAIHDNCQFDIIYIDGSHLAKDVLIDAVLSDQCLKSGGILLFDDYLWMNLQSNPFTPRPAIDAFMECFATEYDLVTSGYQVILKKK